MITSDRHILKVMPTTKLKVVRWKLKEGKSNILKLKEEDKEGVRTNRGRVRNLASSKCKMYFSKP